jgi:hypothetical protein
VGALKTIGTKDNFDLPIITNNTEKMRVLANGNVGIGTSNPVAKLHIKNAAIAGGAPTSTGTIEPNLFQRIEANTAAIDTGFLANGTVWQQVRNVGNLATNYNFSLNPNGGNVGIGTTTPGYKFVVAGIPGTANTQLESLKSDTTASIAVGSGIVIADSNGVINRVATGTLASTLCSGSTSVFCQSGNTFAANGVLGTKDAFAQTFITNNLERVRIDSAGNMGVGTTAPVTKLQVNNGGSALNGISVRANADWDALTLAHDGSVAYMNAAGADNGLAFRVGNGSSGTALTQTYTEGMRILPSGNVGIGTTAPTTKLQVNSGTSGDSGLLLQQIRYGANNPNNGSAATTSTTLAIGVDSNGKVFITNGVGSLDSRAVNYLPQERKCLKKKLSKL